MSGERAGWVTLLAALLLLVTGWYVVSELSQNLTVLRSMIGPPDYRFWVGCTLVLVPYGIYPLVWSLILRGCGAPIPYRRAAMIWWTTNMAKYIPGKVWLITGRVWVARRWGANVVLESFAWEFVIGISSALLAGSILLSHPSTPSLWAGIILLLAAVSLIPLISPQVTQRLLRKPLRWFGAGDWSNDVSMTRVQYLVALLLMTSNWFAWGVALSFICSGIGLDVSFSVLVASYSLAWGLGYASLVTPAGIGVREGALTLLLAPFTAAGVGALLALITRSVSLAVELMLFGFGMLAGGAIATEEEE